jgi:hypothetical protein
MMFAWSLWNADYLRSTPAYCGIPAASLSCQEQCANPLQANPLPQVLQFVYHLLSQRGATQPAFTFMSENETLGVEMRTGPPALPPCTKCTFPVDRERDGRPTHPRRRFAFSFRPIRGQVMPHPSPSPAINAGLFSLVAGNDLADRWQNQSCTTMAETLNKANLYTCNEYREEMILLALQRRLQQDQLSDEERAKIAEEIDRLARKIGL